MRRSFVRERETPVTTSESTTVQEGVQCVHHWAIETPAGMESRGVCKRCGAIRAFSNYVSDFIWEGDSTESIGGGGRKKSVTELIRPEGEQEEPIPSDAAGSSDY